MKQAIPFLFVLLFLSGCGQLIKPSLQSDIQKLKPGNYLLDKKHATLLFKVNHMGLSDFVGRFNEFDAELNFNAENLEQSSLKATVNVASVDVNNASFEETLRSVWWFNTSKYPQAQFISTSAKKISENLAIFSGDLTFMGVTKPLEIRVTFNGGGVNKLNMKYTLGFKVEAEFNRSDFGLSRFIPAVGDKVSLEAHAEFTRN